MKTHYSEADLLETYYTQPGETMPVMMHLATCTECAARYDRLDRKLREAASCHPERSGAAWAQQRAAIMNRIIAPRSRAVGRFVAAAALVIAIGGSAAYQVLNYTPANAAAPAAAVAEEQVPADPWQSEELEEFGAVVEWESWIEEKSL